MVAAKPAKTAMAEKTVGKKQGTDRGKGRAAAELLDAQMAALEKMMAEQQTPCLTPLGPLQSAERTVTPAAPYGPFVPSGVTPKAEVPKQNPMVQAPSSRDADVALTPMLANLQMHLREHVADADTKVPPAKASQPYQSMGSILQQLDVEEGPSFKELGMLSSRGNATSTLRSSDQLAEAIRQRGQVDPEDLQRPKVEDLPPVHFASRPAKWRQGRQGKGAGIRGL